ncbi:MAG: thiamine pyrophosphate-requiring protein [Gemmatimonadota bacterium]
MSKTVADFMIERLSQWGVDRIYGYPGDGINAIMGALQRAEGTDHAMAFVQSRHEELSAFMATAHSKFTGEVGVCLATSGPGAIHLLNGLYDGKMDHQSVVAIVGQQDSRALGGDYQQEVDLLSLFKDVSPHYVHMCSHPAQMRHLVDRAMRIAKAERAVCTIIVPNNVGQMDAIEKPAHDHGSIHSGVGYSYPRVVPHSDDLERAAEILNGAEKVAMLVGAGALGAHEEVMRAADLLGAGVAKALLGKAALDDSLPYVTGSIGLLGTRPSWNLMQDADALFMIGSSFPYSEFLPEEGAARGVQIDIDGRMLGLRYPMEVNLHGDARATLEELIPLLERKRDRGWREKIEDDVQDWWRVMEDRAMADADPVNPQRVFWELSSRLSDDVILTCDSGSSANWWARDLKVKPSMKASLSGNLATMGPGVPYAIAAKFCWPGRPTIAMVGDGAMQMNGINGVITIAKYWERWEDPRLIIGVLNNQDLNQVTWEQRVLAGDPEYETTQDIPDIHFGDYARKLGLNGIRVERPESIRDAWDQALGADRPTVIDFVTDPSVPPLPPHITIEQAQQFWKSMLKGDPHMTGVFRQTARDMIASVTGRARSVGSR